MDDALDDVSLGYITSIQVCRVGSLGTIKSPGTLRDVRRPGRGPPTFGPEGVENVSVVDVDGDGPLSGVRPKAGSGGIAGEGVRLSVIVERRVRRIEPTTDSV
jgi:hypothetical protein